MKCVLHTVYKDGHVTEKEFPKENYETEKAIFQERTKAGILPIIGGYIRCYAETGELYEELMPRHVKGFLRYQQKEAA